MYSRREALRYLQSIAFRACRLVVDTGIHAKGWTREQNVRSETRVRDDVYERVREQFSEDELPHLSLAIVAFNGWKRLNVAARTVPCDYVAGSLATLQAS